MKIISLIKSKLFSRIAGVSIHYLSPDEVSISYIVLKNEGGKLKIIEKSHSLTGFEELTLKLDKNLPIWISISGRQVISRKLVTDPTDNYLHSILPNAKDTDFVLSISDAGTGDIFASAVRYELVQQWIDLFRQNGQSVLGISVGPASLAVLRQAGLITQQELVIPGYKILFDKEYLSEISSLDPSQFHEYWIGSERIENNLLLAFSVAFSYLLYNEGADRIWRNAVDTDAQSYIFKLANRYFLAGALAVVFVLLLINFLVFSNYSAKEKAITNELAYQLSSFKQVDSLRIDISQKTNLIDQMGLNSFSKYGFYADRIAASVPDGISLRTMTINPIQSKIKEGKEVMFAKGIIIQGETSGSMLVNQWINNLEKYDWVKEVDLVNYEKESRKGAFEINIRF